MCSRVIYEHELSADARVTIKLTDPNGSHFRTLIDNLSQSAGSKTQRFNGKSDDGRMISIEGDYTYTITASAADSISGGVPLSDETEMIWRGKIVVTK